MSISALLKKRKSSKGASLLKGSDVPEDVKQFSVTIAETQEPPEKFNAVLIIRFKNVCVRNGQMGRECHERADHR